MTELGVAGGEGKRSVAKAAGAEDILARGDINNDEEEAAAADVAVDSAGTWSCRVICDFSGQGKVLLRVR
jgi:hypothetical protein